MGGIYGGKDIRPISQKQDSLHGLINTILDKLPLGVFVKDAHEDYKLDEMLDKQIQALKAKYK